MEIKTWAAPLQTDLTDPSIACYSLFCPCLALGDICAAGGGNWCMGCCCCFCDLTCGALTTCYARKALAERRGIKDPYEGCICCTVLHCNPCIPTGKYLSLVQMQYEIKYKSAGGMTDNPASGRSKSPRK